MTKEADTSSPEGEHPLDRHPPDVRDLRLAKVLVEARFERPGAPRGERRPATPISHTISKAVCQPHIGQPTPNQHWSTLVEASDRRAVGRERRARQGCAPVWNSRGVVGLCCEAQPAAAHVNADKLVTTAATAARRRPGPAGPKQGLLDIARPVVRPFDRGLLLRPVRHVWIGRIRAQDRRVRLLWRRSRGDPASSRKRTVGSVTLRARGLVVSSALARDLCRSHAGLGGVERCGHVRLLRYGLLVLGLHSGGLWGCRGFGDKVGLVRGFGGPVCGRANGSHSAERQRQSMP